VPEYHREAHCEADYGVDKHNWPIGNCGLDHCASAYQEGNYKQDSEYADEAREENGKLGHANLRDVESPSIPRLPVVDTIHAIVNSDYGGPLEIVVVNDGSQDATLQVLAREFDLAAFDRTLVSGCPHRPLKQLCGAAAGPRAQLIVADKENGGKGDALNAGINLCSGAYVCIIDADTLLEHSALSSLWEAIVSEPTVVAAGGLIRAANGRTSDIRGVSDVRRFNPLLVGLQVIEHARAFAVGRLAANPLGLVSLISGAFGIFRRDVLLGIGGYRRDTVGEDYELVIRIHRFMLENDKSYKVRFVPRAAAWTEVPDTLNGLITQRSRWQRGAMQTFFRHHDMVWNWRYRRIGAIGVGTIAIGDFLIPLIHLLGILAILASCVAGILSWVFPVALAASLMFTGLAANIRALHAFNHLTTIELQLPINIGRLIWLSIADALLYRHVVVLFRLYGILQQIKHPNRWGSSKDEGPGTRA
jgi:cellulose synthase/poly-beta-1,6-N-acetylglucosamine synthase-like glycosyltransferase